MNHFAVQWKLAQLVETKSDILLKNNQGIIR